MFQKLVTSFIALGVAAFVLVSTLGPGHAVGMPTNENGEMEGCIFTGKTMFCKMNVLEHIALWQGMFTALPLGFTLMAMFLIVALGLMGRQVLKNRSPVKTPTFQELYLSRHVDLPIVDHLRFAFSQGILHPRIYTALAS